MGVAAINTPVANAQETVAVHPRVHQTINTLYSNIQDKEFALHAAGTIRNDTLFVTNVEIPYTFVADDTRVHTEMPFRRDYVGTIHSHPKGSCFPSTQDVLTFYKDDRNKMMGIVCDEGIKIYSRSRLNKIPNLESIADSLNRVVD